MRYGGAISTSGAASTSGADGTTGAASTTGAAGTTGADCTTCAGSTSGASTIAASTSASSNILVIAPVLATSVGSAPMESSTGACLGTFLMFSQITATSWVIYVAKWKMS